MPYLDNTENQFLAQSAIGLSQPDADGARHSGRHRYGRRIGVRPAARSCRTTSPFMDACTEKGSISTADLQSFARKQAPLLKGNIAWAAETQVNHWMSVIAEWKKLLGSDWDKVYAASNTIYVARQNNVLFSVLAQFFGPDAINSRLMLIETISFTTTPEDMLEALTRIIADRSVARYFSAITI